MGQIRAPPLDKGSTAGLICVYTLLPRWKEMARPVFFDVRQCVCAALRRADRAITQTYDEILAPSGLHSTQFTLLAGLAQAAPIALNRLAALMGMDRTTFTRNLGPLRKPGWVRVEEGEDYLLSVVAPT